MNCGVYDGKTEIMRRRRIWITKELWGGAMMTTIIYRSNGGKFIVHFSIPKQQIPSHLYLHFSCFSWAFYWDLLGWILLWCIFGVAEELGNCEKISFIEGNQWNRKKVLCKFYGIPTNRKIFTFFTLRKLLNLTGVRN